MKTNLFSFLLLLAAILPAHAQTSVWTWQQYGLSFEAPDALRVTRNNATVYEAAHNDLHLSIQVMDYEGINPESLAEALGETAAELGMSADSDVGELVLTTLEGVYIEGLVDGVNTILVLLFDTESNIALLSTVVYNDGLEQVATDIVNSFVIR